MNALMRVRVIERMTGTTVRENIVTVTNVPVRVEVIDPPKNGFDLQFELLSVTVEEPKRIPDNELHSARCECDACKPY